MRWKLLQGLLVGLRHGQQVRGDAEQVTEVAPARVVAVGDLVGAEVHADSCQSPDDDEAELVDRVGEVGLRDRLAPGLDVPVRVVAQVAADEGVDHPDPDGALEAGGEPLQPPGFRHRAQPGRDLDGAHPGALDVAAGHRQRARGGGVGVTHEQRGGTEDDARLAAVAREVADPGIDRRQVDPVGDVVELGEERHEALGGVRDRVDALCEGLSQ